MALGLAVVVAVAVATPAAAHGNDLDPSDGDVHVHGTVQHVIGSEEVEVTCSDDEAAQDPTGACSAQHDANRDVPNPCIGNTCLT